MDIYADNILDHYKHPHHAGTLTDPSVTHEEINLSCGDTVRLELLIDDGVIRDLAWTGSGCAISQAGMSILSDGLIGKTVADAQAIDSASMHTMLGVPVGTRRLKCALLGLHTLQNALHAHAKTPAQTWQETVGNDKETR